MTLKFTGSPRRNQRGLSLLELLVALTILVTIMVGIAGMLESSWQSFSDLKWQNRVDSEARQALDAMGDAIRIAGHDIDAYDNTIGARGYNADGSTSGAPNIYTSSSSNYLGFEQTDTDIENFRTIKNRTTGINYLSRYSYTDGTQVAALYIPHDPNPPYTNDGIQFSYEYRTPSGINDNAWTFDTVQGLTASSVSNIYFTVKTVYITVTASYNPYPNSIDSRTYTRTLTTAVTLRNPYNMPIPPPM